MKKSAILTALNFRELTSTPALVAIVSGLALAFLATTATSVASNHNTCTVCHKRKQTLNLPCQSSAVDRHLAHGDTAGPCPSSPSAKLEQTKAVESTGRVSVPKATTARVQRAVE